MDSKPQSIGFNWGDIHKEDATTIQMYCDLINYMVDGKLTPLALRQYSSWFDEVAHFSGVIPMLPAFSLELGDLALTKRDVS